MSGHADSQVAWKNAIEEIERGRLAAQADDTGWVGTIVGLAMAAVTLVALMVTS